MNLKKCSSLPEAVSLCVVRSIGSP